MCKTTDRNKEVILNICAMANAKDMDILEVTSRWFYTSPEINDWRPFVCLFVIIEKLANREFRFINTLNRHPTDNGYVMEKKFKHRIARYVVDTTCSWTDRKDWVVDFLNKTTQDSHDQQKDRLLFRNWLQWIEYGGGFMHVFLRQSCHSFSFLDIQSLPHRRDWLNSLWSVALTYKLVMSCFDRAPLASEQKTLSLNEHAVESKLVLEMVKTAERNKGMISNICHVARAKDVDILEVAACWFHVTCRINEWRPFVCLFVIIEKLAGSEDVSVKNKHRVARYVTDTTYRWTVRNDWVDDFLNTSQEDFHAHRLEHEIFKKWVEQGEFLLVYFCQPITDNLFLIYS